MIIDIKPSDKKNKRFIVILDDGKKYNFGLKDGSTYIDHGDNEKRLNYIKRHIKNEMELIKNLIPSPALFSMFLLWGPYKNIDDNIKYLNNLFKLKINNIMDI